MKEHGLPGAMLFSNVNGVPLADARYLPLYQKADELGAVLQIHPMYPLGVEAMKEYWLMPLVGFLMDTTLASAAPGLRRRARALPAHQVGARPPRRRDPLSGRAARSRLRGLRRVPEEHLRSRRPTYLKQFYFDTVNFDPNALMLAVQFAGADHVLAGSDYPHQIGSIQKMKAALDSLPLPADQKAGILGGNAARVYGLS